MEDTDSDDETPELLDSDSDSDDDDEPRPPPRCFRGGTTKPSADEPELQLDPNEPHVRDRSNARYGLRARPRVSSRHGKLLLVLPRKSSSKPGTKPRRKRIRFGTPVELAMYLSPASDVYDIDYDDEVTLNINLRRGLREYPERGPQERGR